MKNFIVLFLVTIFISTSCKRTQDLAMTKAPEVVEEVETIVEQDYSGLEMKYVDEKKASRDVSKNALIGQVRVHSITTFSHFNDIFVLLSHNASLQLQGWGQIVAYKRSNKKKYISINLN